MLWKLSVETGAKCQGVAELLLSRLVLLIVKLTTSEALQSHYLFLGTNAFSQEAKIFSLPYQQSRNVLVSFMRSVRKSSIKISVGLAMWLS